MVLGFTDDEQPGIFDVVRSILHIGNLDFEPKPEDDGAAGALSESQLEENATRAADEPERGPEIPAIGADNDLSRSADRGASRRRPAPIWLAPLSDLVRQSELRTSHSSSASSTVFFTAILWVYVLCSCRTGAGGVGAPPMSAGYGQRSEHPYSATALSRTGSRRPVCLLS